MDLLASRVGGLAIVGQDQIVDLSALEMHRAAQAFRGNLKAVLPGHDGLTRRPGGLYLTGGGSQVLHLKDSLSERLDTQTEILNPFRKITHGREASPEALNQMMPTASVAVGLALRKTGE